MAGSFRHITRDGYKPRDNMGVGSELQNENVTIEALMECYGMIWFLASELARRDFPRVKTPKRQTVQQIIRVAEDHSIEGFARGISDD